MRFPLKTNNSRKRLRQVIFHMKQVQKFLYFWYQDQDMSKALTLYVELSLATEAPACFQQNPTLTASHNTLGVKLCTVRDFITKAVGGLQ